MNGTDSEKLGLLLHFGKICCKREKTNPENILKSMIYPGNLNTKEIEYGKSNEPIAKLLYTEKTSTIVSNTGLHIHKNYPWLACSPDGLIQKSTLGPGLIEIKCIAVKDYRDKTIEEIIASKKNFI